MRCKRDRAHNPYGACAYTVFGKDFQYRCALDKQARVFFDEDGHQVEVAARDRVEYEVELNAQKSRGDLLRNCRFNFGNWVYGQRRCTRRAFCRQLD